LLASQVKQGLGYARCHCWHCEWIVFWLM